MISKFFLKTRVIFKLEMISVARVVIYKILLDLTLHLVMSFRICFKSFEFASKPLQGTFHETNESI